MATDCSQQLEQERLQYMNHQEKWATLQGCHEKLSQFSPEHFQEAKTQACSLQNSWGKKVWNLTWLRCQEVSQQLEDILQELEQEQKPSVPVSLHYQWHSNAGQESTDVGPMLPEPDTHQNQIECTEVKVRNNRDSIHGTVSCFNISFRQSRKGHKGSKMAPVADTDQKSTRKTTHDHRQATVAGSDTVGCQWFSWHHNSTKYTKEDSSSYKIQILPSTFTESKTSPLICTDSQIGIPTCSGPQTSVLQNPIPLIGSSSFSEENARWKNEAANNISSPGMESSNMYDCNDIVRTYTHQA